MPEIVMDSEDKRQYLPHDDFPLLRSMTLKYKVRAIKAALDAGRRQAFIDEQGNAIDLRKSALIKILTGRIFSYIECRKVWSYRMIRLVWGRIFAKIGRTSGCFLILVHNAFSVK